MNDETKNKKDSIAMMMMMMMTLNTVQLYIVHNNEMH